MEDNNPWEPWYDKAFGFVIRADNEDSARELIKEKDASGMEGNDPWLNPRYSTCEEITPDGKPEIIITDERYG